MKKQDEQKHFLSLMARVGDYIFIDIHKLDIAEGYNAYSLMDIDSFTMHFSKEEILASIKKSNLVSEKYLNGRLVIADNQKHNPLEVIDKEFYENFRIDFYLSEILKNKVKTNDVINKFRSICKDEHIASSFSMAIKNNNLSLAMDIIFSIPYLNLRKFIIYLVEKKNKEIEEVKNKERIRDKAV